MADWDGSQICLSVVQFNLVHEIVMLCNLFENLNLFYWFKASGTYEYYLDSLDDKWWLYISSTSYLILHCK